MAERRDLGLDGALPVTDGRISVEDIRETIEGMR